MPNEPFKFTTCAICGARYIKQIGSIYHVNFAGRSFQCCSYGCYQKALKVKDEYVGSHYKNYLKDNIKKECNHETN